MTFQQFLFVIKGRTLSQLLEKSARRYEELPFLFRKGEQVGLRRLFDQLADYKQVQHITLRREEFEKTYTRKINRHLFSAPVKGFSPSTGLSAFPSH